MTIDESLEHAYIHQKVEFLRILELVKALANVLDQDLPAYQIEEDKSRQTTMTISKKVANAADGRVKGASPNKVNKVKKVNQYAPFSDEFERDFYSVLPDYQRFAEQPTE